MFQQSMFSEKEERIICSLHKTYNVQVPLVATVVEGDDGLKHDCLTYTFI